MSVDSGLSGPVEGPVAPAAPRAGTSPRTAQSRPPRAGAARADALADAVSTPSFRSGRGRPRRRGRRVTRILRRIELWSVLKIALVFNTIMLGIALGTVALLWALANTTGLVDDLEGFLREAGFEDFRFQGERMFEQVAFIGAVGALATTVFMVLAAALLNLIAEITGGIRFVVIEEIVEPPRAATSARPPAPLALPTVPPAAPPVAAAPDLTKPAAAEDSPPPPAGAGPRSGRPQSDARPGSGAAPTSDTGSEARARSGPGAGPDTDGRSESGARSQSGDHPGPGAGAGSGARPQPDGGPSSGARSPAGAGSETRAAGPARRAGQGRRGAGRASGGPGRESAAPGRRSRRPAEPPAAERRPDDGEGDDTSS
ncbi:MAG TPA: DUF3566 domain-containing protein [Iamia sp.]|nr:DUF3566 domain-containing protein [Iamia sp.]